METIKIKLYSFNELKEDIKDKVIQDNYDINVNYDWWDSTYYIFEEYGIKIKSFDLYRGHIDIQNILDWEEIAQNLKNNISDDNYLCIDSLNFIRERDISIKELGSGNELQGYSVDYDNWDVYDDRITEIETEYKKDLQGGILNLLKGEYEYLISENAIIETLEANDYKFLKHGARWID